jgi:hypothetical protein
MDDEREMQRLRDELDDVAEQLDHRDRVGEKAPSEDAAFGGRGDAAAAAESIRESIAHPRTDPRLWATTAHPPLAPIRLGLYQPFAGHGHAAYTLRENVEATFKFIRSRAPYGQIVAEPRRPSVLDRLRAAIRL